MAHDQSPDSGLDVAKLAFVAEQSLLAVQLDAEADRCSDPGEAARLHAIADQARALADIEIKVGQITASADDTPGHRSTEAEVPG